MTKAGRPKKAADINGRRLRDSIIEYYGSIDAAAEYLGKSRTWLSLCLKNEAINREDLDKLCQDMDRAPAFYDSEIGGGMLLDPETGIVDRFPAYANNDFYIFWYRDFPKLAQFPSIEWLLRHNFDEFEMPEHKAQLIIEKLRGSDSYTDPGTAADQIREGINITDLLDCMYDALQKYFDRINTDQLTEDQKARLSEKYRRDRRPDLD